MFSIVFFVCVCVFCLSVPLLCLFSLLWFRLFVLGGRCVFVLRGHVYLLCFRFVVFVRFCCCCFVFACCVFLFSFSLFLFSLFCFRLFVLGGRCVFVLRGRVSFLWFRLVFFVCVCVCFVVCFSFCCCC